MNSERIRITQLLADLGLEELVGDQMEILAANEDVAIRRAAFNLGTRVGWEGSGALAESIALESGSTLDQLNLVRSALLKDDIELAESLIAALTTSPEFESSSTLRADILLYDADLNARKGQRILEDSQTISEQLSRATADKNSAEMTRLEAQQGELLREAEQSYRKAVELTAEAYSARPADPRSLYLRHLALQSLFQIDPQPATQQDMSCCVAG